MGNRSTCNCVILPYWRSIARSAEFPNAGLGKGLTCQRPDLPEARLLEWVNTRMFKCSTYQMAEHLTCQIGKCPNWQMPDLPNAGLGKCSFGRMTDRPIDECLNLAFRKLVNWNLVYGLRYPSSQIRSLQLHNSWVQVPRCCNLGVQGFCYTERLGDS